MKNVLMAALGLQLLFGCKKDFMPVGSNALFEGSPVVTALTPGIVNEASGIADSKVNAGYVWVEQDNGHSPEVTLLSYAAKPLKSIWLKNIKNRDWEDMAVAGGPKADLPYIYLADIGDNKLQYGTYFIYRFPEPALSADTVTAVDKISFRYPDGVHDAEAILVEASTKDIYVMIKSEEASKMYKLPYPQSTTETITAALVQTLPFTVVVGAATSTDGNEVILKTYTSLYYWKRQQGETFTDLLKRAPLNLQYQIEPQGEAVCFKNDRSGFFTLSEKPAQTAFVNLNWYKRK